jgi:RNA polymerase sigma-70 factor (ECF subfamily)
MAYAVSIEELPVAARDRARTDAVDVGALFDAHAQELMRFVFRMSGRKEMAEEIVQEVFVTAYKRRGELIPGSNLRAWLYRVATMHMRHHRRGIARWFGMVDRFQRRIAADAPALPDANAERRSDVARIEACLGRLPEDQREVFVMFELQELGGTEIAAALGIPLNTVWSRLRLARARFRAAWEAA